MLARPRKRKEKRERESGNSGGSRTTTKKMTHTRQKKTLRHWDTFGKRKPESASRKCSPTSTVERYGIYVCKYVSIYLYIYLYICIYACMFACVYLQHTWSILLAYGKETEAMKLQARILDSHTPKAATARPVNIMFEKTSVLIKQS